MIKDLYTRYTEDDAWLIKENEWVRSLQTIREAQLAQGNGYMGMRGVLEEIPYDAMPGTYLAGVYDKMTAQVTELVNLPNPFNFKFTVKGEKLDVVAMDIVLHRRVLNLKKGLLVRHTIYQNSTKSLFDYQSLRFVSMSNKNIGVMQIALTSQDESCEVDINTGIDTSVFNAGVLTEGRKRHFRIKELGQFRNAGYVAIETLEQRHTIICCSGFYYEIGRKKVYAKDNIFKLKIKKGQTVKFTKIFYIKRYPYSSNLNRYKKESFQKFYQVFQSPFLRLIHRHIKAWDTLWERADVQIRESVGLQHALRFNIYHMLSCAHSDKGFSSIGARMLSGEGYRGHIFWDAEIFLMPFYLFVMPKVAKNMLMYRYNRLPAARDIAKGAGFRGAMFAWESADTGYDETPSWAKDIDGSIVRIYTHRMEHHITADIAYAVYKYYVVTRDEEFMKQAGYELLFETARFWASRIEFDRRRNKSHIRHVIGPDEFHIDVNDNAFTNMMAKWNLSTAYRLFGALKKKSPQELERLQKTLDLSAQEARGWKDAATTLTMKVNNKGVIEQFDGYFKLKKITVSETDEDGMPIVSPKLKTKKLSKTQLVKQADVLMLLYLLADTFSHPTKVANFDFYIKHVLHKSSLSPAIHSLLASECHRLLRANTLFDAALRTDISNLFGNTHEGIHAASLGGVWQAAIFGFAGVSIKKERLWINPRMPRRWGKMSFSLLWRGDVVQLQLTNDLINIKVTSAKEKIEVGIFNSRVSFTPNKTYTFKRKLSLLKREYYHY